MSALNPVAIVSFLFFISLTLGVTAWAARRTTAVSMSTARAPVVWNSSAFSAAVAMRRSDV